MNKEPELQLKQFSLYAFVYLKNTKVNILTHKLRCNPKKTH